MRFIPCLFVSIFVYSVSAIAAPAASPPAGKKYTVCSATLNSNEEIDTFRKVLGDKKFNYVELTTLADIEETAEVAASREANPLPGPDWLGRSCEQKVQCDILVVSGHFGGKFFGKSGLELGMEDLETAACDSRCNGVLKKPKEVFLFGCNTLAGKEQDFRTPEQYRQVLIQDGFDAETAEQIVAFRYSEIGESYSNRMGGVFQGAPRIYGFSSIAPAGKNVQDMLSRYLKDVEKDGYYKDGKFSEAAPTTNSALMKALKLTHIAQVEGIAPSKDYTSAVCYLNDHKKPINEKLRWIESALSGDQMLAHLPYVTNFLTRLKDEEGFDWDDKSFEPFENLSKFANAKKTLRDLVLRPIDSIISVQAKAIEFQSFMGWLSEKESQELTARLILGNEKTKWTIERADSARSAIPPDFQLKLPYSALPANQFTNPLFLEVLSATRPSNPDLIRKLIELYKGQSLSPEAQRPVLQVITTATGENADAQDYVLSLLSGPSLNDKLFSIALSSFRSPKMADGLNEFLSETLDREGASPAFWQLLAAVAEKIFPLGDSLREKLASLRDKVFAAELSPNAAAPSNASPACSYIFSLNGLLKKDPPDSLYRLNDWPKIARRCDAQGRQRLTQLITKAKEVPAAFLDEYLASLVESYRPDETSGVIAQLKAQMKSAPESYPRFNAALANKFRKDLRPDGSDAAVRKLFEANNFPYMQYATNLMESPENQKTMIDFLVAEQKMTYQFAPFLLASGLSDDSRTRLFEHYWNNQKDIMLQSTVLPLGALTLTPSLVPQYLPELLATSKFTGDSLVRGVGMPPDMKYLSETVNSDAFIKAFVETLAKMDKSSQAYTRGAMFLESLQPKTETAKQLLRNLASDANGREIANAAKLSLLSVNDAATVAALRNTVENRECGPTKDDYYSQFSKYIRDILLTKAKEQVSAGIKTDIALGYLFIEDSGLSQEERIAYANEFLSQAEKMPAQERQSLYAAIHQAFAVAELSPSGRPELYAKVKSFLSWRGNPGLEELRLAGHLAYRMPEDKDLERYALKFIPNGDIESVRALVMKPTYYDKVRPLNEKVAASLIKRLKTDKSMEYAVIVAGVFPNTAASLKQRIALDEIFAGHPLARARESWASRNGADY